MSATVWDDEIDTSVLANIEEDTQWDEDIDTSALEEEQPEYVKETPQPVEEDEFLSEPIADPMLQPEGTIQSEENENQTIDPYTKQQQDVSRFTDAEERDVSKTLAEIQQSITTTGDQLGWTDDSEKAVAKYNKEATRVLKEKGYRINANSDGTSTVVGRSGNEYPMEPGMLDEFIASKGEVIGSIGGGITAGATVGALGAGPIGAGVGGLVGGTVGAIVGDQADVDRNAEKYGIEISKEERQDRMLEVGVADTAGSIVGGIAGKYAAKGIGKIFTGAKGLVGDAIDKLMPIEDFTTLDAMTPKYRKAVQALQDKTGLDDEGMEKAIKDYAKTVEGGKISQEKAVEAGSVGSETEQYGLGVQAAKGDDAAKIGAIKQSTDRTNTIEKAFGDDEELQAMLKRRTLDDKGRRKATNWEGLRRDMEEAGFEAGDPTFDAVTENAKAYGLKEAKMFNDTVRPATTEEIGTLLKGVTDSARGSFSGQVFSAKVAILEKLVNKFGIGEGGKAVKIIRESMKKPLKPKQLQQDLVEAGLDTRKAKQISDEIAIAEEKAYKENATFDAKAGAEEVKVDKARKKIVADATKKANQSKVDELEDWKSENVIPGDLGKKLTRAKTKGDWDAVEDLKTEILKRVSDKEEAIQAGIKTAKKEKRVDVLKKGTEAKAQIKSDYKDMKEGEFVDAEVAKKTAKQEKRKGVIEKSVEQKTKRAEAKAKAEATAQKEADDLAVATRKQRTKEVTATFEKEAADWEDANHIKGFTKRYGLAKRDYKKAIGTEDEAVAKKEFDTVKKSVEEARAKEVEEATAKREPKAIAGGTKQTEIKIADDGTVDLGEIEVKPEDFVEHKPLSQRAKDKIVQHESGKTGRSPQELNTMQGDEYTPVPDIAYDKDALSQKELMDAEKQMNKNLGAKKMHEIEAGEEAKQVENALKSNDLREDHRDALELVMADPQYSRADQVLAEERIGKLNREKAGVIMRARTAKQTKAEELVSKPVRDMSQAEAKSHKLALTALALKQIPNSPKQLKTREALKVLNEKISDASIMGDKRGQVIESLKESNPAIAKAFESYKSGGNWGRHLKKEVSAEDFKAYNDAYKANKAPVVERKPRPKKQPIIKANISKEEKLANKGRNITAKASRSKFMDTYDYNELVEADKWIAEVKERTGKTRSLNEYVNKVIDKR